MFVMATVPMSQLQQQSGCLYASLAWAAWAAWAALLPAPLCGVTVLLLCNV